MTSTTYRLITFISSFPKITPLQHTTNISLKTFTKRKQRFITPSAKQNLEKRWQIIRPGKTSNNQPESNIKLSDLKDRQVWSAGERPPIANKFAPGKFPFAVELDFFLNHPITDSIIILLVILNCFVFALQTLNVSNELHHAFESYEQNVSILFLLEYFGRWYGKGLSPRFLFTREMLIDFIAVAPIGFAVTDQSEALFVRLLRLIRIFRLQRVVMGTDGGKEMMVGMSELQVRIARVGLSLFSLLYVSAGLFFQVEKDVNPGVDNFFDAFYFTTITLFTVGFGDVTPLTSLGRTITVMTVLTGAFLIPFKLSEVEEIREISNNKPKKKQAIQSSIEIECNRCHLQGHQKDARFCRNCGSLLKKRMFD